LVAGSLAACNTRSRAAESADNATPPVALPSFDADQGGSILAANLLVTQGTVVEVADQTLVLEAQGDREQMDLDFGRGATIASEEGILTSDDPSGATR
jgi:hypothetical protein